MRIVSLLPSATEMVAAIGLAEQLVGVTHECDYPAEVQTLPKVTRSLIPAEATSSEIDRLVSQQIHAEKALYALDVDLLAELQPDLIVTQTLCDVCAVAPSQVQAAIAALPRKLRVVNLEPTCLTDVFQALLTVGQVANREAAAHDAIGRLQHRVAQVTERAAALRYRPRTMLLEWIDPPFCAGHWNPELVQLAGGQEMLGRAGQPSRRVDWNEITAADPEVMLIACCGFPIDRALVDLPILQSHPHWKQLSCVQSGRVYVTDGSAYFNRPGPRLVDSLEILAHAIDPEVHPLPVGRNLFRPS